MGFLVIARAKARSHPAIYVFKSVDLVNPRFSVD